MLALVPQHLPRCSSVEHLLEDRVDFPDLSLSQLCHSTCLLYLCCYCSIAASCLLLAQAAQVSDSSLKQLVLRPPVSALLHECGPELDLCSYPHTACHLLLGILGQTNALCNTVTNVSQVYSKSKGLAL